MLMNSLSLMDKNIDVNKQLAYMRNYINQLRDEIENDLMNIGYDNLDADLRKRFDDMQTGLLTANNTSMEVAGILKTQYLKADEIAAKYITAQTVAATYATIGSLNAVSAAIGDLAAIAITTQNLSAQSINANQITAGKIKANQIDASDIAANAFTGTEIKTFGVQANAIAVNGTSLLGISCTSFVSANTFKSNNVSWSGGTATVKDINNNNVTVLTT